MYIRTTDGVYENANPYFIEDNKLYMGWDYPADIEAEFLGDIIAQSDTIEELCDEFVIYDKRNNKYYLMDYDDVIEEIYCGRIYEEDVVYGAIWTEKGLIYVAKMDNGGKLELI